MPALQRKGALRIASAHRIVSETAVDVVVTTTLQLIRDVVTEVSSVACGTEQHLSVSSLYPVTQECK
ncbi:hypothetical protein J6590_025184 [Homalodisca vitripennis]|nr:hypothetical protein J6590_025184 [Homalodisca vitripennis]